MSPDATPTPFLAIPSNLTPSVAVAGLRRAAVQSCTGLVEIDFDGLAIGSIRSSSGALPVAPASPGPTAGSSAGPGQAAVVDVQGAVVVPAFVEPHVHLDKAYLLDRLEATGMPYRSVQEAMLATSALRPSFHRADLAARAERCLAELCDHGVCAARVHVELEPVLGLLGVEVHLELRERWAPFVDLQLVAFPQNGFDDQTMTLELLDEAMRMGCDVVGGCPYADGDQASHVTRVFELAQRWDAPADFHVDFSDDPAQHAVDIVIRETLERGMGGSVTVGHLTSLAAMPRSEAARRADGLAAAGIHVVALPATDLYLGGRDGPLERPGSLTTVALLAERGVTVSLGTNNTQNAFTPLGRPSPLAAAWLAGLACHLGDGAAQRRLLDSVTANPARLLGYDHWGLHPGGPAELAVLDTRDAGAPLASASSVLGTVHAGRYRPSARPRPSVHTTAIPG